MSNGLFRQVVTHTLDESSMIYFEVEVSTNEAKASQLVEYSPN